MPIDFEIPEHVPTEVTRKKLLKELREGNVLKIVAEYNGWNDEGNIEEMKYLKERGFTVILPNPQSKYKDFVWQFIQEIHEGFENGAGAEGIFEWDLEDDIINIKHDQRYLTTQESEHKSL